MSNEHQEKLEKWLEKLLELLEQLEDFEEDAFILGKREGLEERKRSYAKDYKKGHSHGCDKGCKEGRRKGYLEGQAAATKTFSARVHSEASYNRGYKQGRIDQAVIDQVKNAPESEPEPEPASFAYLAGHTTEAEYQVERWARGRALHKSIIELEPLVDSEALASFLRQEADEIWLEATDCFLADLMNCFSRHLPLTSSVRSWLIRTTSAVNQASDERGVYRWKGGGPLASQGEEK